MGYEMAGVDLSVECVAVNGLHVISASGRETDLHEHCVTNAESSNISFITSVINKPLFTGNVSTITHCLKILLKWNPCCT